MLGLLARSRRRTAPPTIRFARLGLERLETRDCPSTLTMYLTYGPQHQVTLYGSLIGAPNVANQPITFSGVVSGTTYTDANGDYSATLVAQNLGTASAQTADGLSNVAQVTIANNPPVISNFFAQCNPVNSWTFTGMVTDEYPAGLIITFGGNVAAMIGVTTTVQADGTFSYTKQLTGNPNDNGIITAQTVDWWGAESNVAMATVSQTNTSGRF